MQRIHPQPGVNLLRRLDMRGLGLLPRHQLDQRQQVDRVEGVRHDQPTGCGHLGLQVCGHDARGGRGNDAIRVHRLDLGIDLALDLDPLRHRLDDQVCTRRGLFQRRTQRHGPFGRQRLIQHHRHGAARVGHHFADLALGLRVRVIDLHAPAVQCKPRGPAAADHSATNDGCCLPHLHVSSIRAKPIPASSFSKYSKPHRRHGRHGVNSRSPCAHPRPSPAR